MQWERAVGLAPCAVAARARPFGRLEWVSMIGAGGRAATWDGRVPDQRSLKWRATQSPALRLPANAAWCLPQGLACVRQFQADAGGNTLLARWFGCQQAQSEMAPEHGDHDGGRPRRSASGLDALALFDEPQRY